MVFTDQTGYSFSLQSIPQRIISLVPSQTELLYDLGLNEKVVGITKFCIHPDEWFRKKTRVGGTKNVNFDTIDQLHPDLILANKEENQKEQIEELRKKYTVWTSDPRNLEDALDMILRIGELTGEYSKARLLRDEIENGFNHWEALRNDHQLKAVYLIWKNPIMVAGQNTFINDMMTRFGLENAVISSERYPQVTVANLKKMNPELILLSSEPYPFREIDAEEFRQYFPGIPVLTVDGEMFSWYGSRLTKTTEYFQQLNKELRIAL